MKNIAFLGGNVYIVNFTNKKIGKNSVAFNLFNNLLIHSTHTKSLRVYKVNKLSQEFFQKIQSTERDYDKIAAKDMLSVWKDFEVFYVKNMKSFLEAFDKKCYITKKWIEINFNEEIELSENFKKYAEFNRNFLKLLETQPENCVNCIELTPVFLNHQNNLYPLFFVFYKSQYSCLIKDYENLNSNDIQILKSILTDIIDKMHLIRKFLLYENYDKLNIESSLKDFNVEKGYLTMGFEAEFECLYNNSFEILSSLELLKFYYEEDFYDMDEDDVHSDLLKSPIGVDGSSETGELRSEYYNIDQIDKLIANGKGLIREICEVVNSNSVKYYFGDVLLSFVGYRRPLGFHIHIGFSDATFSNYYENVHNIIKAFDLILGKLLFPLNCRGRKYSEYSRFSNMEEKSYGFEYRSLSAAIIYNDLYKDVLKLAAKIVKEIVYNEYLEVPLNPDGSVSIEFYKKHLKGGEKFIRKLTDLIRDIYTNYCYLKKNGSMGKMCIAEKEFPFNSNLLSLIKEINKYMRNSWIFPVGLRNSRGDLANNVSGMENYININNILEFPYVEREIKVLNKTYNHVPLALSYKIRTQNYNDENENPEIVEFLAKLIYKFLKNLENRKLLKLDAETVYKKLKQKYKFLNLHEAAALTV